MKLRGDFPGLFLSAAVNSETREEVVIKKIGNAFDNRIDAKRTLREIKLLRHMDHENVSFLLLTYLVTWFIFPRSYACLLSQLFLFNSLSLSGTL